MIDKVCLCHCLHLLLFVCLSRPICLPAFPFSTWSVYLPPSVSLLFLCPSLSACLPAYFVSALLCLSAYFSLPACMLFLYLFLPACMLFLYLPTNTICTITCPPTCLPALSLPVPACLSTGFFCTLPYLSVFSLYFPVCLLFACLFFAVAFLPTYQHFLCLSLSVCSFFVLPCLSCLPICYLFVL